MPLSKENALFNKLQKRIQSDPAKREEIRGLFVNSFDDVGDQVIGARGEDILTMLKFLVDGRIPIKPPARGAIRHKEINGLYIEPIDHPFYNEWLRKNRGVDIDGFVTESIRYASGTATATFLKRNADSFLKRGWQNVVLTYAHEEEIGDPFDPTNPGFAYESLISRIHYERKRLDLLDPEYRTAKTFLKYDLREPFPLLHHLTRGLVRKGVDRELWVNMLLDGLRDRKGVLIGFNGNVVQGELVAGTNDSEVVIVNNQGFIDLTKHPIASIEALGNYERFMLQRLGIFR